MKSNKTRLRMITLEELLEIQTNEDEMVLLDVLSEESYSDGHLPGAVHMPADKIDESFKDELEQGAKIVTYCAGYTCNASTAAARKLMDLGVADVLDFKAGKKGWQEAGFELEKTPAK